MLLGYLLLTSIAWLVYVIVKELRQEALAETGDWLIVHRERSVKPPAVG